ncbi:hypothetical protein EV193_10332 [Herbihabitans rhizosphaerae]|uniref:Secreted protein n=1 Tax=Herbihabitans rhizosphaerae TaxID=1872711 RepID=A0A4Q7KXJ6_9PSEU|nr:hypothetical protein [Herbihabitans rhizosphaerae]RZS40721.1 hypothetical protein EV193_10332 [Herbihabitans rhizosphaerae]
MTTTRLLARGVALAAVAATALAMAAPAASAEPVPTFDFADCPSIPAGANPAEWRCEVMMATGTIRVGGIEQSLGPMRLTFAEGRLDGKYAQVFGALRTKKVPLGRGLLSTRLSYAGYSDFQSNDQRMGDLHVKLDLVGSLLPEGCAIGSDADPIKTAVKATAKPEVVSENPLVVRFPLVDNDFAVPRTHGCGLFGHLLNRRLGLPSPSGENSLSMTTYVSMKGYA